MIHLVNYRGEVIQRKHLTGCIINGDYFKPNGTGGEKLLGSATAGKVARYLLKKLPSEKYQAIASLYHDIMCEAGGDAKDKKFADKKMRQIAIAELKNDLSFFNPKRHVMKAMLWRNWYVVSSSTENFKYNREAFILNEVEVGTESLIWQHMGSSYLLKKSFNRVDSCNACCFHSAVTCEIAPCNLQWHGDGFFENVSKPGGVPSTEIHSRR